ncbi:serine/threonine-protein phosphatase 4 regulatory subunit 2-A-like [Kryptolebias marmoratus]|uniref:Protein phosphatase 4, regulatory subunit 2a n=1 Tax=Kryptolebias marmoratus TaxID=37003 RepID=A0A3Q3FLB2_KRYMA|nr:serine/threonine-protein phosphatase 4 regulatory subunit 2-A-like [Kryptolebias marmoratus]
MDIDTLLEAFQDFEKKGKKEVCPVLEQFLCHVAKTGQPVISWLQFKSYFMFKLEKVMDDFHASTPEQRGPHNPNVEYVAFEEMKKRILKIVDGYNGIPFTIQRLCELLTDPKRNYTGTDKFLRGLEKNVMVVSCVYPTSEKNGVSGVNRMNGVMFPGNSPLYSDSRNVNGPGTPKTLNRPKLSMSTSLSTNGLPDCPVSKEPGPAAEVEEHPMSEALPSEDEMKPKIVIKNKHPEEEEDADCNSQEAKRLKFDVKAEDETKREEKESSCHKEPEHSSNSQESPEDSREPQCKSETSCDAPSDADSPEPSGTQTEPAEKEGDSAESAAAPGAPSGGSEDQPERSDLSETNTSSEQDNEECSSSSSSSSSCDRASSTRDGQVSSSSNSPGLSTEGGADISDSAETAIEPGEHD